MNNRIQLFRTQEHDCPYLPDKLSTNILVDPNHELCPETYDLLLENGFRRSADMVYRPGCSQCQECKSTRIPVNAFTPNRSQRRTWKKVADDIVVKLEHAGFKQQHFELYQRYTRARHKDGNMAHSDEQQYLSFLTSQWSDTLFIELWYQDELLAVAVTDRQPDSLSALYTFYSPAHLQLSPGILAILCQIDLARRSGLQWLYLGYWIKSSEKMAYKTAFQPIHVFQQGHWQLA